MRYKLPPLNGLRAFEAAARHLSFTRAAEELCVTQGAISRHILILEEILGLQLFLRQHRHIELTPEGARYLTSVRNAFEELHEATQQLASSSAPNTLNIKLLGTFAQRWLMPRLGEFNTQHPDITVRVTVSHYFANYGEQDIDASVEYGAGNWTGLVSERLYGEVIVPVCSPRLASGLPPPRRAEELSRHVFLHSIHRPDFWRQWLTDAGVANVPIEGGLRFENSALVYQAAREGLGIAIAHVAFVEDDLASGRLIIPINRPIANPVGYYLVYPANKLKQKKLAAFRKWILAAAAVTEASLRGRMLGPVEPVE